jgi:hypothetical protein
MVSETFWFAGTGLELADAAVVLGWLDVPLHAATARAPAASTATAARLP